MDNLDNVSLGLWLDDPPKVALTEGYFRSLVDCNIDCIAIMIDRSDRKWLSTWSPKQIERALKLADPHCIEVVLTTWPYPDVDQITAMARSMSTLMNIGPVAAWESDLEFNWKSKHVSGFRTQHIDGERRSALDLAGDFFLEKAREVCDPINARVEVTSFTQHTENGSKADVAPHVDRLLVQAYSCATRKRYDPKAKKSVDWRVPWNHTYGPGKMQRFTLDRTLMVPGIDDGKPEVGCGLAAWSQRWPNHKPDEPMQIALQAAMDYDVVDIRWWSSKHVIGVKKNPYAAKFLESLSSLRSK